MNLLFYCWWMNAKIMARDKTWYTAIDYAIQEGCFNIAKLLEAREQPV